ncbi:Amiloride-sensitive sodium channel subunit like protein [Argiope bruennichi]|uniref:Amiloride-sensitive sodium channel subunit like protein n=1 Tax=Argiope bruennichi TaxID=94029 RepID=A0A8T0FKZ7_ARGBR|nr:Amiloride-sensitive sodium channel subunit like protein [Argiope bruennichi]
MKFEEVKLEVGKGAVAEPLIISERRYNYKTYQSNSNTTKAKNNSLLDFTKKWYQMNVKERFIKGHDPSVFIHKCTWNGKICPKQYLSHFNNLRYGNCVTFNKKKDLMFNFDSSFGNGLQLILDLEPEKYLPITPVVGAVLVIHDPEDTPTPEEKGYIITPGYETFIGLKQSILIRLPAPYKDHCVDYSANFLDNIRNKKECIRKCIQMANYNQCRCIDLTFGILNDLKFCDLSNDTEAQCLNSVLEHMCKIGPMCNCPLHCISVSFGEQLSKSRLRSEYTFKNLSLLKSHTAIINIFYSSFEKRVYEQKPQWDIPEFLSILGNEFGLWLGSCLVIVAEILEGLVLFMIHTIAGDICL